MTDATPDDAMLRAKAAVLLTQTHSRSNDLERALGATQNNPALRSRLAVAAAEMAGVADKLSQALGSSNFSLQAADFVALEGAVHSGEVGALVAEATSGQQSGATAAAVMRVEAASVETRHEVESLSHDVFEKRIFDKYLDFSSPTDEATFRQREAASRKYIDEQLARGTPEGDLNAGGGMQGYMLDAHDHGAGDSPDFLPKWNALAEKTKHQRDAMQAAGQSTAEYDRNLEASIRRSLKGKGMSDVEIDRQLAGHDLLEVADSIAKGKEGHDGATHDNGRPGEPITIPHAALPQVKEGGEASIAEAPSSISIAAMAAKLKTAGVEMTDAAETAPAHGVNARMPVKDTRSAGIGG